MSGATYRIDVEHRPDPNATTRVQWVARVIRLSDEYQVQSVWGESSDDVIAKAREYLRIQHVKQSGRTLFVNDEGADEMPHSVKA